MSRRHVVLLVVLATLLVWYQAGTLPWPARLWTALLMVPLPALMIVQARLLQDITELPRAAAYASSVLSLWALLALTALVAALSGFGFRELGVFAGAPAATLAWTAALTLAGVALLFLTRALGFRDPIIVEQLMPTNDRERVGFVALSVSAGVCEELIFRGFLLYALLLATGSPVLALVLSSGAFGVIHAYQSGGGALRAGSIGALFAVPILLGQPILAPILAHTLVDLLSGLWLHRYLLR